MANLRQIIERVFDDRNNTNILTVKEDNVLKPWTGVTKFLIDLIDPDGVNDPAQIDTSVTSGVLAYPSDGRLEFTLGGQSVPAGTYHLQLVAVDGSDNKEQIIHPDRQLVKFIISATETIA